MSVLKSKTIFPFSFLINSLNSYQHLHLILRVFIRLLPSTPSTVCFANVSLAKSAWPALGCCCCVLSSIKVITDRVWSVFTRYHPCSRTSLYAPYRDYSQRWYDCQKFANSHPPSSWRPLPTLSAALHNPSPLQFLYRHHRSHHPQLCSFTPPVFPTHLIPKVSPTSRSPSPHPQGLEAPHKAPKHLFTKTVFEHTVTTLPYCLFTLKLSQKIAMQHKLLVFQSHPNSSPTCPLLHLITTGLIIKIGNHVTLA